MTQKKQIGEVGFIDQFLKEQRQADKNISDICKKYKEQEDAHFWLDCDE